MNHEVTAAVDVLNAPATPPLSAHAAQSPDAIAELGDALAAFSTRVARRERELHKLFEQIAVERNSLLDAVLTRLMNGFAGIIPFDGLECAFLSDDGASAVSYWSRGRKGARAGQPGHVTLLAGSRLLEMMSSRRPLVINDLLAHVTTIQHAEFERRLIAEGARAALVCPLIADAVPLGFLFFTSMRPAVFTDTHASLFQRSAGQVSIVVQKTRGYGEVVDHNRILLRETRRLHEAATTDALTGVLNRRALDGALATAWERYEREGAGFGIIMCDLDHFKQVNDTHGHAVGDKVLAASARCLARALRGADLFGRFGGEEFLAIVDTPSESTLGDVAERLRAIVARERPSGIEVTASFGAAACHRFTSLGDLIVSADHALYAAKTGGRNRYVMANEHDVDSSGDAPLPPTDSFASTASSQHGER